MEDNVITTIARRVRLQEGAQAVEKLLTDFYLERGESSKDYAVINHLPVPLITAIKNEAAKLHLLESGAGICLSEQGRAYIEDALGYRGVDTGLLRALECGENNGILASLTQELDGIFCDRPQVDVTVDQSKCTAETAIKRALLCLEYGSLIGKRILCVGDDDFISVAIGLVLRALYAGRMQTCKTVIYVFDSDERVLGGITEAARKYDLPICCRQTDLRETPPQDCRGTMDCFFTDPPYTLPGMKLFLSRGLECLKKSAALPVFFSYAHKSQEEMLALHRQLIDLGLCAMCIVPDFNRYEGAGILGSSGQMMVLKTTESAKSLLEGTKVDTPIYTGEIRRTRRKYVCKACGSAYYVGIDERLVTIERLKETGCQACGHHNFDLVDRSHTGSAKKIDAVKRRK